ncbi:uncharacterized protein CEXT_15821 [Caerostris extrusa]|uniref:Uncharacterized protein n=1 Tax=Caerostris extrusa TaxID=172846 RepID=A0AAV4WUA9_CAEEX|nr:uncharacterized protein CEXT_15821 [Caerostris extrusa]
MCSFFFVGSIAPLRNKAISLHRLLHLLLLLLLSFVYFLETEMFYFLGRPEVTAVNKSLMAIAGRSALLAGQLCSSPRPLRVFWVLRNLVLRPGDVRHPYVAYNLTETEIPNCYMLGLELRRLRVEDSGEVVLVVKNAHGIADALFLLNVTRLFTLRLLLRIRGSSRKLVSHTSHPSVPPVASTQSVGCRQLTLPQQVRPPLVFMKLLFKNSDRYFRLFAK